ncbi:MAG: endopeptidase La [Deltaproteobacteria bacterium]|nr:endopeptidase La [Deltaproteobacteria bacterium]
MGNRHKGTPPELSSMVLPLLPLRNLVFFPHTEGLLPVGRARSMRAIEEAMASADREIFLSSERPHGSQEPGAARESRLEDVFAVGTIVKITNLTRVSARMVEAHVVGVARGRITRFTDAGDHHRVDVEMLEEPVLSSDEIERTKKRIDETHQVLEQLEQARVLANDFRSAVDPSELADRLAAALRLPLGEKQRALEELSASARLEMMFQTLVGLLDRARSQSGRVKARRGSGAHDRALVSRRPSSGDDLGDDATPEERDEFKSELDELESRIESKAMSKEAKVRARRELRKLRMMAPMSAEATVVRNYLDWILMLPWSTVTPDKTDIEFAETVLDEDHYGLKTVKDRILEYLAVRALSKNGKAPILCFVGPPGVGKTSLARSIARATGKKFVRQSLGGVRDEAEVRGHRRTYIGAMPGKVLQMLKKAGASNPVFLLDEVDKMSSDFRGDPASALLEALDPEQNVAFNDHYLDLDYDLSRVMFITTANSLVGIPPPLQDRMEIIRLAGYTDDEKLEIAKRYLFKKQREACGLGGVDVELSEAALKEIIARYTREAGVRGLEREIGAVCRKVAKEVVGKEKRAAVGKKGALPKGMGEGGRFLVNVAALRALLGPPRFRVEARDTRDQVGVATGLAWTEVGGEILTIEVTVMPGKGKLIVTGKLGDVMKESATAAMSYVRSRAHVFEWAKDFYQRVDVHIHVPEGATPKDGPSAGITMATSLVSALSKIPVRNDVAMTGEITLRGRVLPVGGIKEKLLAAHREGITSVVMCRDNEKDLVDLPKKIRRALRITLVSHMDDVLRAALVVGARQDLLRLGTPVTGELEDAGH